jgi:hypothetical protein
MSFLGVSFGVTFDSSSLAAFSIFLKKPVKNIKTYFSSYLFALFLGYYYYRYEVSTAVAVTNLRLRTYGADKGEFSSPNQMFCMHKRQRSNPSIHYWY